MEKLNKNVRRLRWFASRPTNGIVDQAQLDIGCQAEGGEEAATTGPSRLPRIPPSLESGRGYQLSMSTDSVSVPDIPDRWAEIIPKTELRRPGQRAEDSVEDTQDDEAIVADLTDDVESEAPVSTQRNQERRLPLHIYRRMDGVMANSPNLQPAPSRNDDHIESVDMNESSSEPSGIKSVEASTNTSSVIGSNLTPVERDPFCRPWYSGSSKTPKIAKIFRNESWYFESILTRILSEMGVESARSALESFGITDLWLPLSKQLLKRSLIDPHHISEFLALQDGHLKTILAKWKLLVSKDFILNTMFNHCEFEDDEEVFEENRLLGEGMVGLVQEVTVRSRKPPLTCVRKKIARPKQLKAHQQIMAAFIREIKVMRQVNHRHCVRFLGSYTDNESVNILSTPVADMDLGAFLDKPIGDREWAILYKGIDCLCNGL